MRHRPPSPLIARGREHNQLAVRARRGRQRQMFFFFRLDSAPPSESTDRVVTVRERMLGEDISKRKVLPRTLQSHGLLQSHRRLSTCRSFARQQLSPSLRSASCASRRRWPISARLKSIRCSATVTRWKSLPKRVGRGRQGYGVGHIQPDRPRHVPLRRDDVQLFRPCQQCAQAGAQHGRSTGDCDRGLHPSVSTSSTGRLGVRLWRTAPGPLDGVGCDEIRMRPTARQLPCCCTFSLGACEQMSVSTNPKTEIVQERARVRWRRSHRPPRSPPPVAFMPNRRRRHLRHGAHSPNTAFASQGRIARTRPRAVGRLTQRRLQSSSPTVWCKQGW